MKYLDSRSLLLLLLLLLAALASCDTDTPRTGTDPSRQSGSVQTYVFHGIPLSIDTAQRSVMVDHEEIEGYMEPMTMPFKVADTALFAKVRIGERMRFVLHVAYNAPRITDVEALPPDGK
jgi:Cu/Ag efflux protein CusF